MTDYEKFYWMLDMIPMSKESTNTGVVDKALEDNQADLDALAEIYTILQPAQGSDKPTDADYDLAMMQVIKVLSKLSRGTKAIGGNNTNDSTPPVSAEATPLLVRKSIYFIAYTKYAYEFGFNRNKVKIKRAGFQQKVLDRIAEISSGSISLGHNTFTKWGLHPEADFIEGTYIRKRMPFKYTGQKSEELCFMLNSIAESVQYSNFIDLFGGSGVCSLARAYNPSIKEFINDYNYQNVCYYLALHDENYKAFKDGCKDLLDRIENPVIGDAIYNRGLIYWRRNVVVPFQDLLDEISAKHDDNFGYKDSYTSDFINKPFMYWNATVTEHNIIEIITALKEYLSSGIEDIVYGTTINYYDDKLLSFLSGREEKEIFDLKERDKLIYAQGLWYYADAIERCITVNPYKKQSALDGYAVIKPVIPQKYKQLTAPLLAMTSKDLIQKLGYDNDLAVLFVYKSLFMRVTSTITSVTLKNARSLAGKLKLLDDVQKRFKSLTVLFQDANEVLELSTPASNLLSKIRGMEKSSDTSNAVAYLSSMTEAKKCESSLNNNLEIIKFVDSNGQFSEAGIKGVSDKRLILSDSDLGNLTRKTLSGIREKAEYTVDFFKNTLIYLDSPYFDTVGYASPFDFKRFRNAVNAFIGKYIYSCRVSVNSSSSTVDEDEDIDYEKVENKTKKVINMQTSFKSIVDYYRDFTSAEYVCMYIKYLPEAWGMTSINEFDYPTLEEYNEALDEAYARSFENNKDLFIQYIKENISTDDLEIMFTNFDFKVPKLRNMLLANQRNYLFDKEPLDANFVKMSYKEFIEILDEVVKIL